MNLATLEELEALLGRDLEKEQRDKGEIALKMATGRVQAEARQHLLYVEDEVVELHPQSGREIMLPQRPVTEVAEVKINGIAASSIEFTPWGRLRWPDIAFSSAPWVINLPERDLDSNYPATVVVKYSHGYAEDAIPEDVKGVCLALAARLMVNTEGLTSEQMGSYAVTYGDAAGLKLTSDEVYICRQYRPRV